MSDESRTTDVRKDEGGVWRNKYQTTASCSRGHGWGRQYGQDGRGHSTDTCDAPSLIAAVPRPAESSRTSSRAGKMHSRLAIKQIGRIRVGKPCKHGASLLQSISGTDIHAVGDVDSGSEACAIDV